MENEIQADYKRWIRAIKEFGQERTIITIASISLVVSILALLMAWMAVYDAIQAKSTIEADERYSSESYRQLEREYRLLQLKVDEHRAAMMAHGIDPNFHLEGESN